MGHMLSTTEDLTGRRGVYVKCRSHFQALVRETGTINRLTIISSKVKKKELDLVINIHDSLYRFAIVVMSRSGLLDL